MGLDVPGTPTLNSVQKAGNIIYNVASDSNGLLMKSTTQNAISLAVESGNRGKLIVYSIDGTTERVGLYGSNYRSHFDYKLLVGSRSMGNSAVLECVSTTLGFLPPRMTNAQMLAIDAPQEGLIVYDLTNHKLNVYNGSAWEAMH